MECIEHDGTWGKSFGKWRLEEEEVVVGGRRVGGGPQDMGKMSNRAGELAADELDVDSSTA